MRSPELIFNVAAPDGRLLKAIREERKLALSLTSLGLTPKQAVDLISDPLIGRTQTEEDAGEGVVDASDRAEDGDVIIWWNNIEKDKRYVVTPNCADVRYKSWPSSISGVSRNWGEYQMLMSVSETHVPWSIA